MPLRFLWSVRELAGSRVLVSPGPGRTQCCCVKLGLKKEHGWVTQGRGETGSLSVDHFHDPTT